MHKTNKTTDSSPPSQILKVEKEFNHRISTKSGAQVRKVKKFIKAAWKTLKADPLNTSAAVADPGSMSTGRDEDIRLALSADVLREFYEVVENMAMTL